MKILPASIRIFLLVMAGAAALATTELRANPRNKVGVSVGIPLPHGYVEVAVGRQRYYTHRGVFYRRGPHGLMVVRAPRGAILRELPPHCARIYVGNVLFFRYGDVYYQPVRAGYVVVDAPVAVNVPPPPPSAIEYQSVWVGDMECLFKDGQFFRKTPEGLVWMEAPLGAITTTLPPDATSIWYQDNEYFECDDVYFHRTPEGYKVVPAPFNK
jgi:hypothetical protein